MRGIRMDQRGGMWVAVCVVAVTAWLLGGAGAPSALAEPSASGLLPTTADLPSVPVTSAATTYGPGQLAADGATVQAVQTPEGSSDLEGAVGGSIGYVTGTLLVLLVVLPALVEEFAGGQHRASWRAVRNESLPAVRSHQIIDVTSTAKRFYRWALWLFVFELVAVVCLAYGVITLFLSVSVGMTLLFSGVVMAGVHVLRRRFVPLSAAVRSRRPAYLLLKSLSVIVGLFGFVVLILATSVARRLESSADATDSSLAFFLPAIGVFILIGAVSLHRLAVRIALSKPSPAVPKDSQPPMLYLRSFADDNTDMGVSPFARRSLLERLSSYRRQTFEEVIAEELQRHAPVVAVGEPGRRLAPIGFVRESLPNDTWKAYVQKWMECSAAIVVVVGRGEGVDGRGEGLKWEIGRLLEADAWRKTVFLIPPVEGDEFVRRWAALAQLLSSDGRIRGIGVPSSSTYTLAITLDEDGECRYWCGRWMDAWSYKAAVSGAVRNSGLSGTVGHSQ